ncbi:MAG: hypothetical protein RL497_2648, partial [Pseudomonadota bacterium]
MTSTLKVIEAWDAADGIYRATKGPKAVSRHFQAESQSNLKDLFNFSGLDILDSKTGAFFKVKSGFGTIVPGNSPSTNGEYLITLRGTDLKSDWLTDANSGLQSSRSGKMVHAGFNRVFNELEPQISRYFSGKNPSVIHCVGHSLGGALASLTADWVTTKNIAQAKLYTFGCPRVGLKPFAERITSNLGAENIFRVHHDNDFVSLVPIWPFVHIPQPGTTACLENHGFGTFGAHKMTNYNKSLVGYANQANAWESLRAKAPVVSSKREIETWLSLDTASILCARTLSLIGEAIEYILKAAGIAGMLTGIVGLTVLDKLSFALEQAWNGAKEVAGWVEYLIKKIMQLTGTVVALGAKLTATFIRWVFKLLFASVARLVELSLR